MSTLDRFMDADSRVKSWPAKKDRQIEVIEYIAAKFDRGRLYTEKEVAELIDRWHTFGDHFLIRRTLVERGCLARTATGSRYWLEESETHQDIAALIAAHYDIGSIGGVTRLSSGIGSKSYYVLSSSGEYILKDIEQNGMNHPENEAMILEALRSAGIPASTICRTRGEETVLSCGGGVYHLQNFIAGKVYNRTDAPQWLLHETAKTLGKMQRAMAELPTLPVGMGQSFFSSAMLERAKSGCQSTLELATERADTEIVDAITSRQRMLRTLDGICFDLNRMTCCNTHGDYKLAQIISGKDRINGVIDFTSACVHPICWEVFRSYLSADSECTDGDMNIDNLLRYVAGFLEHGIMNDYDLEMMPYVYYYQNLVTDYFRQLYSSQHANKQSLLMDALDYLKQCQWLEANMTKLEDALTEGF